MDKKLSINFEVLQYGKDYKDQIVILDILTIDVEDSGIFIHDCEKAEKIILTIAKRKYGEQVWIRVTSEQNTAREKAIGFPHTLEGFKGEWCTPYSTPIFGTAIHSL